MAKEPRVHRGWLLAVILAAALLSGPVHAASKPRPPRTVVDYYMLLPDDYFSPSVTGRPKERLDLLNPKRGGVVDTRNGYIQTTTKYATQEPLTVCLFKRPDHSYLVAVSANLAPDDGSWEPFLQFYAYQDGHLVNITRSTLPRPFNRNLGYKLPRYGKTIRVITASGKTIYKLTWMKRKFQIQRVR